MLHSEHLNKAERRALLAQYDALPRCASGSPQRGSVDELCRKWRISRDMLREVRVKRTDGK